METDQLLPAGTYLLKLVHTKNGYSAISDYEYITLRFEAVDIPYTGVPVYMGVSFAPMADWWLTIVCKALKTTPSEFVRRPDLSEGALVIANVGISVFREKRINTIKKITSQYVAQDKEGQ